MASAVGPQEQPRYPFEVWVDLPWTNCSIEGTTSIRELSRAAAVGSRRLGINAGCRATWASLVAVSIRCTTLASGTVRPTERSERTLHATPKETFSGSRVARYCQRP